MTNREAAKMLADTKRNIAQLAGSTDPETVRLREALKKLVAQIEALLAGTNDSAGTRPDALAAGLPDEREIAQMDQVMGLNGSLLASYGFAVPPAGESTVVKGIQTFPTGPTR